MRIVFMKGRSLDSNAKGVKVPVVALFTAVIVMASAGAGAWVQSRYTQPVTLSQSQERALTEQVSRDSHYIRGNVNLLASKVGSLQAKLIEMDGLSKRVAAVAGVPYTDPEVQAGLDQAEVAVMDYIDDDSAPLATAESLGRHLDSLQQEVAQKKSWFTMLDLVLTRRAGVEARLPTLTPVNYPYLSSSFGWRRHPISGRHIMHEGLDFSAPKGTAIYAASGGVVSEAGFRSGYGNMVEIQHGNGLVTRYAHASKLSVKTGDLIEKGQMIARVGSTGRSTGPHLHFEVRMAGHPVDPTLFLASPQPSSTLLVNATQQVQAILPEVR